MTSTQSEIAPTRQRIAKLMARVGLCSRRDAEAWIVDGRVSVNGEVLTSPAIDVGPEDAILVNGAPLPAAEKTRLFLFHKPRGLVTSDRDPEGRATVADFLREHWPDGPRVVTVGRLDINTEGLLLLTNDGGLARMLELPKTSWVRRYRVRAKGETDQAVLDSLRDGMTIDGVGYAGIEATLDRMQGANTWLTMGLREGKNREVKRVLEAIGLEVNRLIRLSFGPFQLGDLAEGAVEEVRTRVLRDQLGAALAAAAGVAFEDAAPPPATKPVRGDRKPGRTVGAERVNKGERPQARAPRDTRPRGGERPLRRPRGSETPSPLRERPAAGSRKHVSALRAEESEAARRGPRRRVERGEVTDRQERSVRVERLVDARPGALAPTRTRGERPARRDEARTERRQASPSALAKRARMARSGGYGTERDEAAPRREPADGGNRTFSDKRPRRDAARPLRAASDNRPSSGRGGDRTFEGKRRVPSAAPRTARVGNGGHGASGGHHIAGGSRGRPRPGERPRGARTADAGFDKGGKATSGGRHAGRQVDGDRRRRDDGSAGARHHNGPQRDRSEGASCEAKRFEGKRPGPRSEHAPRGGGQGAGRRGDVAKRDGPRAGGDRRKAPSGGRRPGGGKPPSRPGGSPGRGKPRPKG